MVWFNGCGKPPAPVRPVARDSYQIVLTQLHSNATKRSYALHVAAAFPFEADITSGTNFSDAGRSVAVSNGNHAIDDIRFLASRSSSEGSTWLRDHAEIQTSSVSLRSSVSVKMDRPIDQTLSLTATNGTYRVGAPLLLGVREGVDLKLHITASPD